MLPGVRFVFAATVLAVSVVIFGLGAAAFLRAAHDNLASATIWRPIDEPLAGRAGPAPPTLAMLRVDPEPMEAAPAAGPGDSTTATVDMTSEAVPVATPLPAVSPDAPSQMQTDGALPVAAESEKPVIPVQAKADPAENPAETMAAEAVAPVADPAPPATVAATQSDASAPANAASEPAAAPETVVAALATEPKPETLVKEASKPEAAAPVAAETPSANEPPASPIAAQDGAESMPGAATAPGTDTLKTEDRQIKTAMATDTALPDVAPLPAREVRLPAPRIDPSVLEARRKQLIIQQQARKARAAKARRVAAVRARATAQARAAAAADPFGNPANTFSPAQR